MSVILSKCNRKVEEINNSGLMEYKYVILDDNTLQAKDSIGRIVCVWWFETEKELFQFLRGMTEVIDNMKLYKRDNK